MINVKNVSNQPLEDAYVFIEKNGLIIEKGHTDVYGNYYTEVPDGRITFVASTNGYKDTILETTITGDKIITLVMEEPAGFFTMFFSTILLVCVIFGVVKYVTKSG